MSYFRIYFRFIDDILIASLIPININEFKAYFLYLKLNIEYNESVKNVIFTVLMKVLERLKKELANI